MFLKGYYYPKVGLLAKMACNKFQFGLSVIFTHKKIKKLKYYNVKCLCGPSFNLATAGRVTLCSGTEGIKATQYPVVSCTVEQRWQLCM